MTKPHEHDQGSSKQAEHFETRISDLYQHRKSKVQATASMKRQLMQSTESKSKLYGWFSNFQHLTFATATILLLGLVAWQSYELRQSPDTLRYTSVEIHNIDEQSSQDYRQISQRYQQHYQDYLQQKALLASHHQKSAILTQFENGWELRTCDQELVKISKQLIDTLQQMNLINGNFKTGDSVEIAFNVSGLIVGIHANKTLLKC
ncbi:hypothetical protein Q4574_16200 [Aliiglaciecola sp. 3_MG-2023]|uniref:hypothetical protein n=1 Tax=Aliiglaciecola sp. 3_MG-2023 TaxID=3062644 RepID=UPI0026E25FAE|nr:hypothetical protein [Aliiglaciecola sp. 3_MG-2023]MDO6694840.1 hypothetical protein [Aliiglaciecola sp. 3_MG-2023]